MHAILKRIRAMFARPTNCRICGKPGWPYCSFDCRADGW